MIGCRLALEILTILKVVEKDTKLYFLKEELLRLYCNAAIEKCYFCNSDYGNANPMEVLRLKIYSIFKIYLQYES